MSSRIMLFVRIVFSGVLICFVTRKIDVQLVVDQLKELRFVFFVEAIIILVVAQLLGAFKWSMLYRALRARSILFRDFLQFYLIGYFYTFFLPGGQLVGEGMKAFRMSRNRDESASVIFSQVLDRLTGLSALGIIMAGAYSNSSSLRADAASFTLLVAVVAISVLTLSLLFIPFVSFFFGYARFLPEAFRRVMKSVREGYRERRGAIGTSIVVGLVAHVVSSFSLHVVLQALGIHVPFAYTLWLYLSLGIVMFFPISYAGIGVREGIFMYYLGRYGIPQEIAISAAVVFLSLQVLVALAGGVVELKYIWKNK